MEPFSRDGSHTLNHEAHEDHQEQRRTSGPPQECGHAQTEAVGRQSTVAPALSCCAEPKHFRLPEVRSSLPSGVARSGVSRVRICWLVGWRCSSSPAPASSGGSNTGARRFSPAGQGGDYRSDCRTLEQGRAQGEGRTLATMLSWGNLPSCAGPRKISATGSPTIGVVGHVVALRELRG